MGTNKKPWADLSSAERLDVVLLAVADLEMKGHTTSAGAIALEVSGHHEMDLAGWGKNSTRNGLRRMSTATRVTPAITALRKRGLLTHCSRRDDLSGSADTLTIAGIRRVKELRR